MCGGVSRRSVRRHAALIEFLTVAEDVLAHFAEVDIEVATVVGRRSLLTGVDKGVEHPEFDVLDVGCLEVVGVQLSHHTAPMLLRIVECSVVVEVRIEVVRSALVGVIGEVEDGES